MTTKVKKGLAIGLMILIIAIAIILSNQVIAETSSAEGIIAEEKEMVSLRTISIVIEPTATTEAPVITTNPKQMTIVEGKGEDVEASTIVIKRKKLKAVKKYLSLKEVRKKINLDMDISKLSGLSKEEFVKLVQNMDYDYTGVFKRNAEFIWDITHKYQINEIFFMGIIALESGWGSSKDAISTNNYTSQMKVVTIKKEIKGKTVTVRKQILRSYSSEKECLKQTAEHLHKDYLNENSGEYYNGKTIYAINENYCIPGYHKDGTLYKYQWGDKVYRCMKTIVGK